MSELQHYDVDWSTGNGISAMDNGRYVLADEATAAINSARATALDEARRAVLRLHFFGASEHHCTCQEECDTIDAAAGVITKMIERVPENNYEGFAAAKAIYEVPVGVWDETSWDAGFTDAVGKMAETVTQWCDSNHEDGCLECPEMVRIVKRNLQIILNGQNDGSRGDHNE